MCQLFRVYQTLPRASCQKTTLCPLFFLFVPAKVFYVFRFFARSFWFKKLLMFLLCRFPQYAVLCKGGPHMMWGQQSMPLHVLLLMKCPSSQNCGRYIQPLGSLHIYVQSLPKWHHTGTTGALLPPPPVYRCLCCPPISSRWRLALRLIPFLIISKWWILVPKLYPPISPRITT